MQVEVKVPSVGESVQEGEIFKWHKNSGEFVNVDEVLVELETDKATMEIVSEAAGVVTTLVPEGDTVAVGDIIAKIDTEAKSTVTAEPTKAAAQNETPSSLVSKEPVAQGQSAESVKPLSPAVDRMVREHKLASGSIPGTGRDGRILKDDVLTHIEGSQNASSSSSSASSLKIVKEESPKIAHQEGGRTQRRVKMSRLRQRIAERLVEAQHTAAILTTFNEVDMTAIMSLRKKYKEPFKDKFEVNLGFMSFFVKACVLGLKEFPAINAYIDNNEVIYNDYVDVGIAVSTERGLIVPIIRNCETLSFPEIERTILHYAQKGRDGKISLDDLSGGTFTLTNGGVFGSLVSTPILTPPQSAILGMHKIQERPVVINGQIVARPMMYLALSYDHRMVDGKEAVSFLVTVKNLLEDPTRILLGV